MRKPEMDEGFHNSTEDSPSGESASLVASSVGERLRGVIQSLYH